jgi:hypothetical protein
MAHTFHVFDLTAILLAAASAVFMIWVFWNLTLQIRREVRTRVAPPETTWTAQTEEDRESTSRPKAGSRSGAETFERRFAPRVVR